MKQVLCAILLALPALALAQQCSVVGDVIGFSLDMQTLATEKDCLKHCQNNTNCQWYSFDTARGSCNSLYNKQTVESGCSTCRHGEKACRFPSECYVRGGCQGSYIGRDTSLTNAEECLEVCYKEHNCKWFTFLNVTRVCNLYSACSINPAEPNAISGERDCYEDANPPQRGFSKIFLQHYYDTAIQSNPSINASGDGTTCTKPAQYPLYYRGTAGQIVNGQITICGTTNACYRLNQTRNAWETFPSMPTARGWAADVMTPRGWWITGGYTTTYVNSSILWNGTAWSTGPSIPLARFDHCMVQLDDTQTFMAGGQSASSTTLRDAYIYNWLTGDWIDLPNMPVARDEMACTTYKDANGTTIILTAGDVSRPTSATSFNLATRQWKTLTALPSSAWSATFVHDGDDIVLVNPYYRNLMRFNKTTERFTTITGYPTALTGDYTTVIPVNDEHLTNCS